jgi:hypothetical protein
MTKNPLRAPAALLLACAASLALAGAAARPAAAEEATCVTLCQQKVDECASQCEALAGSVYDDPASLRECQLACAKGLFVSCVQRCSDTGEVGEGDYGIVAPDPDRMPPGASQ